MAVLLYEFQNFPEEREAIGKMLIAYGEIEFAILSCLGTVLNNDMPFALRILFRVQGEGSRLAVADAILRQSLRRVGLDAKWGNAFGAAKACKGFRNQYAHCHWQVYEGQLRFMNLDAEAQSPEGEVRVAFWPVDGPLIAKQLRYFEYTLDLLYFLQAEYLSQIDKGTSHAFLEPKSMDVPPRYIQPDKAALP
jgi:hypothetical protein